MNRPWMNLQLPPEQRVEELLEVMTLSEKIGQLHQVHNLDASAHPLLRNGDIGSVFNASGENAGAVRDDGVNVRSLNQLQKITVEESRLGIPLLFARDVIHGHRTVFPIPLAQAATWDPELVRECARVTAREASSEGIRWTFTPMLDVSRDPRWGRIAESFGEDPWLASRMAQGAIRGYQGEELSHPDTMAACAKHFAGYSGAEGGRDYWETHCGEREMRDVYLPPFKAAVDAGVATIMSAFHVNDGVPASADRHLLTDILRTEWGFNGFVVSDYGIVREMHTGHGVYESVHEAACHALNAGLDMDMMSHAFRDAIGPLIDEGSVTVDTLNEAVRRVLRIKFRCGLFERPYADESLPARVLLAPNHRALARAAAADSMVLLHNNGILPLPRNDLSLLVTGPFVHARAELFGCWTLDGRSEDVTPLSQALAEVAGAGVNLHCDNQACFGDLSVQLARRNDVVVACIGEAPWRSGEGNSIAEIELPAGQLELLTALHRCGKPIVAVVFAGRPLNLTWLREHTAALLYAWHPGIEGGYAIADLLFGDRSPRGRLPASFPRCSGQIPVHYSHRPTHRPGSTWETAGWYKDGPHTPLYPFGFGLSYTSFSYSDLVITPAGMRRGSPLRIEVTLTNTGTRPGTETAQLYLRDVKARVSRPVKELKGMVRVDLAPGQSQSVAFTLTEEELSYTGPDYRPTVENGVFHVWVGPHADEGLEGEFELSD